MTKRVFFFFESSFCHNNSGFNLTYTPCIFRYHATQTAEIFHILWSFLTYHNMYWERWVCNSYYLRFIHFYFHSTTSSSLSIMPCSTVSPMLWVALSRSKYKNVSALKSSFFSTTVRPRSLWTEITAINFMKLSWFFKQAYFIDRASKSKTITHCTLGTQQTFHDIKITFYSPRVSVPRNWSVARYTAERNVTDSIDSTVT